MPASAAALPARTIEPLVRYGKKQLIAIGVVDLHRVVSPPGFFRRDTTLEQLAPEICQTCGSELNEQARLVGARRILTQDDLTLAAVHLTHGSRAVRFVPGFLEAQHVDIESDCAIDVSDEEDRPRVPSVNRLVCQGVISSHN